MDLSRLARRRYTPYTTPMEPLPRFLAALAADALAQGADRLIGLARAGTLRAAPGSLAP